MAYLQSLTQEARDKGARRLLLEVGQRPRIWRGRGWESLDRGALNLEELKREISGSLGELHYKNLTEKSVWEGEVPRISCFGQFRFAQENLMVHLKWSSEEDSKLEAYRLPPHLLKGIMSSAGLSLVIGPKRSGRSCFLQGLALACRQNLEKQVLLVSDEAPASNVLGQIRIQKALHTLEGIEPDLIFIDQKEQLPWKLIRRWIDLGSHVVMVVSQNDMPVACEEIRAQDQANRASSGLEFLKYLFSPRLFLDKRGRISPLLEIISNHRSIKDYIRDGDWDKVYGQFKQASNAELGRTLNQAITQALVDQKMDFQQAFEMSPDPEELDLMLKRMGI